MEANAVNAIDRYIERNIDRFLEQLGRLCAEPSVSAQGSGIAACSELVASMLRDHGLHSSILPTDGNPVVYGDGFGRHDKTLLFYLHYDVQPVEPIDLWDSPPFALTRRGDKFYARGVSDDKGHIVTRLAALEAVRATLGELPCNVKFLIEGEEEIGSPHLFDFIEKHQERLSADACIWEYGGVNSLGQPEQSLGMRGIFYVELSVQTAAMDAHSGLGGSIFPNAAWRLVWALNTLKAPDERVRIPGFYDDVVPPSERDLEMLASLPDEAESLKHLYGLRAFLKDMEGGLDWKREAVFAPTCTICGLESGYQGVGAKTVLPASAKAKVDFRLVPDQKPAKIERQLRQHLDESGFADVELRVLTGLPPARVDPDDPFVKLADAAAVDVYGSSMATSPIIGGSGPLYPFVHLLGMPVVAAGIGYPGAKIHAPNENMRLDDFIKGIRHTAHILCRFAES